MSEQELIVKDYVEDGLTLTQLMKKYHHNYEYLTRILDSQGIQHNRRKKKGKPNPKNRKQLTEQQKAIVLDMYINQKRGQVACGRAVGISPEAVKTFLKEQGISIRKFSEAATASNTARRTYPINDHYFDIESPNMAYILGFLAADGSVSKDCNEIKIGLSAIDKDLLQVLADELGGGRPVKEYTNSSGYECCEWHFASKRIKDKLAEYNIVPSKTFSFKFPTNLNRRYWVDFIRGYFDGDGSVSTAGASAIRWQLCSATKDVLQHIVDFFYEEYGIPKVSIYEQKRVNTLYYIQYSSISTREIYKHLYTENSLYLPRKKEKYEQLLTRNLMK